MNIAMTSYYLPSTSKIGVGYQAHYMATAMTRRGHRVVIFSPSPAVDGAEYETRNVPVGNWLRTFRFAWNLRKMSFSDFDVIHAHGDDYWLWRRRAACHVKTMHGSCLTEAWNIRGIKQKVRMLALAAGEVLASFIADRTVAVSQNTCRSYPWIRRVIPNGVDLSCFCPSGERETYPTILFVGTYRNRKRGQLLMEAFQRVVQPAVPDARLWMVCDDAPAANGVTVFGRVPLNELADLYRRAWVFSLPSSYEGFGVPYIEAMASGTPVVATPNPGACEVLEGGRFGILTEPDNLGSTIVQLLRDRQELGRLRDIGLQRAREFGWDTVSEQYEQLYAEVIRTRPNCSTRQALPTA
jgi:phosphatidylinositol alpha-mannosyltransferase